MIFSTLNYNQKKIWNIYQIFGVISQILLFLSVAFEAFYSIGSKGDISYIWLNCLGFFTQQSNLFVMFVLIFMFFFPKWKIFNNNNLLICALAYISFTFVGFNFILLPTSGLNGTVWQTINSVFMHMVNPIYVFIFAFLYKKNNIVLEKWNTKKTSKLMGYGIIYPVVYWCYAAAACFLLNFSVYGDFTNINPFNGGSYIWISMYFLAIIFDGLAIIFWWWILKYLNFNKK